MVERHPYQAAVRVLCALALLLLAFGHQPPALSQAGLTATEIAQYVLPDGSLPTLCLGDHDDGTPHPLKHGTGDNRRACDVCRLTAGMIVSAPLAIAGLPVDYVDLAYVPERAFSSQTRVPPDVRPRAPPISVSV